MYFNKEKKDKCKHKIAILQIVIYILQIPIYYSFFEFLGFVACLHLKGIQERLKSFLYPLFYEQNSLPLLFVKNDF